MEYGQIFSPEARTVLFILKSFKRANTLSSLETIRAHDDWMQLGKDDQSLTQVLDQLVGRELVSCTDNTYSLTKQGYVQLKQFQSEAFSDILLSIEQSATSRKFCKQVYGLDLCQYNMMSGVQLDKLLEVMNLSEEDHLLDLGCGVGLIAEYISDVTGASVVGIDFAAGAIRRAQERSGNKRERLAYQVMDMEELYFPGKRFSGMIAIDTLYMVNDLKGTVQSAKACLQENGRMEFFYSTTISAGETEHNLEPERTPLAKVLQECELDFQTWDFTQDEREIWVKILNVSEELKQDYEAEGNLHIYEDSVAEAKFMLEAFKTGSRSRYLYHVQ